jgi:hypothetical protein
MGAFVGVYSGLTYPFTLALLLSDVFIGRMSLYFCIRVVLSFTGILR